MNHGVHYYDLHVDGDEGDAGLLASQNSPFVPREGEKVRWIREDAEYVVDEVQYKVGQTKTVAEVYLRTPGVPLP